MQNAHYVPIPTAEPDFMAENVNRSTSGWYMCEASNEGGKSKAETFINISCKSIDESLLNRKVVNVSKKIFFFSVGLKKKCRL